MIETIFNGITRHSPEGIWIKQRAEEVGFNQAWPSAILVIRSPAAIIDPTLCIRQVDRENIGV